MKTVKIIGLIMVLALGVTACGQNATQSANATEGDKKFEGTTLNVYNWGDYMDETVLDTFHEETGISVNYEYFDSNEAMYTKIKNSGSAYDVIFPSDYMISKMIAEDMLAPLNYDNIPNYEHIADRFKDLEFDPGNKYSVPYMWGTLGILYNTTLVEEPIDSWQALFDEKYAGQ
ncbi:MAG: extracellular solute-binding protein, partial [Clostridiales bacterium]|nr:extracellular solute-binding protein [Clostridiales bacterium]